MNDPRARARFVRPEVDPIVWEHGRRNMAPVDHGVLVVVLPVNHDQSDSGGPPGTALASSQALAGAASVVVLGMGVCRSWCSGDGATCSSRAAQVGSHQL